MNNLPDLILNDIKNKISNGDTAITVPIYVYDMFKDEFEEKGYTIIKNENNNYNISIPLLLTDGKKDVDCNYKKYYEKWRPKVIEKHCGKYIAVVDEGEKAYLFDTQSSALKYLTTEGYQYFFLTMVGSENPDIL
jgi:hypothetical protein